MKKYESVFKKNLKETYIGDLSLEPLNLAVQKALRLKRKPNFVLVPYRSSFEIKDESDWVKEAGLFSGILSSLEIGTFNFWLKLS